jgi:hypothetical protein
VSRYWLCLAARLLLEFNETGSIVTLFTTLGDITVLFAERFYAVLGFAGFNRLLGFEDGIKSCKVIVVLVNLSVLGGVLQPLKGNTCRPNQQPSQS